MRLILLLYWCCLAGCSETEPIARAAPSAAAAKFELLLNHPLRHSTPMQIADSEIGRRLIELINSAKTSIDFAIYGIRGQDDVLSALKAAKTRGVRIRGVVDRNLEGKNYYSDTEELVAAFDQIVDDWDSDKETAAAIEERPFRNFWPAPEGFKGPPQCIGYSLPGNKAVLAVHASREELKFAGDIMHNKFFVIDSKRVWTGSCNVSDTGTGGYNANIAAVIDSTEVASWYQQEFLQMFSGEYHRDKKKHGRRTTLNAALSQGGDLSAYFSPQGYPMERGVRPLLKQAKSTINVAVFFLTHKKLTGDLIKAHQRGVKVRVIIDATAATNGYTKHEILRAAGIPLKVENWGGKMHMKACSVDGRHLVVGSMNWTSAGESKNDENTLVLNSPALASSYDTFFEDIWATIPDRWLSGRPDPESRDSGTSWSDGVDNDFDHLVDLKDPGCGENPPPLSALPPYRIVPKRDGYSLIKGNVNREKKRYYHLPTDKYYNKTKIDVSRGEQWFPSILEAREAGWTRPWR